MTFSHLYYDIPSAAGSALRLAEPRSASLTFTHISGWGCLMALRVACLASCFLVSTSTLLRNVIFDDAEATNAYSTGASSAFSATQATSMGAGYWCSSGSHAPTDTVGWTGVLNTAHGISGLRLNWAYSPGDARYEPARPPEHDLLPFKGAVTCISQATRQCTHGCSSSPQLSM